MEIYLTEVRHSAAEKKVHLSFNDGHSADFDDAYLRGYCPCAGCQGHEGRIEFRPPPGPVGVATIEEVGNYAISLAFTDGHNTGIYRFEFLREICPCAECAGEKS
jgi:DUF971 family protein